MESLLDLVATLEHRQAAIERRVALWRGAALLMITTALVLLSLRGVTAQGDGSQNSLKQQVATLQGQVQTLQTQVASLTTQGNNQANQVITLTNGLNQEITDRQNGDAATKAAAIGYTDQ